VSPGANTLKSWLSVPALPFASRAVAVNSPGVLEENVAWLFISKESGVLLTESSIDTTPTSSVASTVMVTASSGFTYKGSTVTLTCGAAISPTADTVMVKDWVS